MSDITNLTSLTSLQLSEARARELNPETKLADDERKLRQAAQGFEGLFLQQMLKAGRAANLGDDLFGSDAVDKTQDMFDMELSRISSAHSGLGISDAIYRQFAGQIGIKE